MKRVLEPEVMDTEQDATEYDAMDFSEANERFADRAAALLVGLESPRVADLGTGNGLIPLLLLDRVPNARIVAVDLAESMLAVARRRFAEHPRGAQIEVRLADAKSTGLPDADFDLVLSNSTAHHIPAPLDLFRELARLRRVDGALLVGDLARPATLDDARAVVERVAPNDGPRQKQLFFDSLCAALTLEEVRACAEAAGLAQATVAVVSDRHWNVEIPRDTKPSR